MPEPRPEVSVVMPVRNVARTVELAVMSIVDQTVRDWELVVLDDGSTDDTVEVLRTLADRDERIHVHVDGRSRGIAQRLNQGVGLARAPYVARMDGDDLSLPERLELQLDLVHRRPEVDLVGAGEMVFSSDGTLRGRRIGPAEHADIVRAPLYGIPVSHPTWLGRRDWFLRHGYDTSADACEDQELLLRASAESTYANVQRVVMAYREDRIKLDRSVAARRSTARYLVRYGRRHGRTAPALVAAAGQLLRGARDAAAVWSGREELVLRRRVGPATAEDEAVWARLRPAVVQGRVRESP